MASPYDKIGVGPEDFERIVQKQMRAIVLPHDEAIETDADKRPPRPGDIVQICLQLPGKSPLEHPSLGRRITHVENIEIEDGERPLTFYVCSISDGLGY